MQSLTPTTEAPFPCIYIYVSVVIAATRVTSDEKQHKLPDINIVEIDCELSSDTASTRTSDKLNSAGKQKLT